MRAEAALLALAHAAVYVVEGDGTPGLATLVVAVVGHFRLALALVAAAALAKRAMGGELWIAKVFTRGDLAVPDPDGGVAAACGADWEVAATCLGSGGRGGRGERRPATGRFPGGLVANLAVSPACTRAAAGGGARDRFDAVRTAPWLTKAAALRTSATAREGMSKKRTISSMVDANTAPHGVFEDRGTGQAGCSEDASGAHLALAILAVVRGIAGIAETVALLCGRVRGVGRGARLACAAESAAAALARLRRHGREGSERLSMGATRMSRRWNAARGGDQGVGSRRGTGAGLAARRVTSSMPKQAVVAPARAAVVAPRSGPQTLTSTTARIARPASRQQSTICRSKSCKPRICMSYSARRGTARCKTAGSRGS